MIHVEPGITKRDGIYFCTSDSFTKNNLFYILWGAIYSLDKPYRVDRSYMDAFMLQYIMSGELNFILRGKTFTAKSNEVVLLNCHEENLYWAERPTAVKWFHFNGQNILPLFNYIYKQNKGSGLFKNDYAKKVECYIDCIIEEIRKKNSNVFSISHNIYSILCELSSPPTVIESPTQKIIQDALNFIQNNYDKPISVGDIAAHVNLSGYYFTHLFSKYMHLSPHTYLLNIRLESAKKILIYTFENIETISIRTGFQSSSHFIRAFKKANNITPNNFRKIFYLKNSN